MLAKDYVALREQILNETSDQIFNYSLVDYHDAIAHHKRLGNKYWIFLAIYESRVIGFAELIWNKNEPKRILDRKSTRLNSSHTDISRMPSSA